MKKILLALFLVVSGLQIKASCVEISPSLVEANLLLTDLKKNNWPRFFYHHNEESRIHWYEKYNLKIQKTSTLVQQVLSENFKHDVNTFNKQCQSLWVLILPIKKSLKHFLDKVELNPDWKNFASVKILHEFSNRLIDLSCMILNHRIFPELQSCDDKKFFSQFLGRDIVFVRDSTDYGCFMSKKYFYKECDMKKLSVVIY